jgi:aryl-alcohol dehydrogenase-like predicted oxidoreductase
VDTRGERSSPSQCAGQRNSALQTVDSGLYIDSMLIPGYATEQGTQRYSDRFSNRLPKHFRSARKLQLSSIGVGTYLGDPTEDCDRRYISALTCAVEMGVNVIDSAINYRHQRSERAVGSALAKMISEGKVQRDEIFVATKGGFLALDAEAPPDSSAYFYRKVIESGLAAPEDVAAECHVISPAYLKNQIDSSRENLGVETIDLYYLHNPETQLSRVDRKEFYSRVKRAFVALEEAVVDGKICAYGTATWNAYRAAVESADAVPLAEVLRIAREAGGAHHHFCAIQFPFNFAMLEALINKTQVLDGRQVPLLHAASEERLMVFASASLLQGQLADGLPDEIRDKIPGLKTDAQRSIQFVRSTPGITSALVGMSQIGHVEEDLATAALPPLSLPEYRRIFAG